MIKRKRWTDADVRILKREYPNTPTRERAERFGRTMRSVYVKAKALGLRKSKAYMQGAHADRFRPGNQRGKATQFKPGHRPHNKGKKGWQAGGNAFKTKFKKGHRPHNWVPVGSERISREGILQRKITDTGYPPRDWKSVHSLLWEKHHGPVPPGHIVVFRNGKRGEEDIHIENLELITRAENMRRNTIHHLPQELADVIRLKGVLNRHIHKRERENEK